MQKIPTDFELLHLEIQAHLNPELMTKDIEVEGLDKRLLERYSILIHVLNQAFKKVCHYEVIFEEFYPATPNISTHEALEHHMHAYLSDIMILRNAINRLIGSLKNDVLKVVSNKAKMSEFFTQCKKVTNKQFSEVTDLRDAHNHAENRFVDPDLTRASSLRMMAQEGPIRNYIKPEAIEHLVADADQSFQRSKKSWCETAKANAIGIGKAMDALFISLEQPIYKCLGIKPVIREQLKEAKSVDTPVNEG